MCIRDRALVVDDEFHLIGMITVKDFQKAERKPNACKDEQGRLRVGAAAVSYTHLGAIWMKRLLLIH